MAPSTCRIHPTAVVSPEVELGEGVEIGAFAVLEGRIRLGDHCLIRPGAYLFGPLTMGPNNVVHTGAILGDTPQHLKYAGEPTSVEIGAGNVFRENVTVHRGTTQAWKTVIGNENFFMAGSHVGHDSVVGNRCLLANGALIGGHCEVADQVYLSGNCALHQFVRIGRLALLRGLSGTTKDVPPFVIQKDINNVVGVNVIGMRRAGIPNAEINAVREAFKVIFRDGFPLPAALAKLERDLGEVPAVQEMIGFLHGTKRGINHCRTFGHDEAA